MLTGGVGAPLPLAKCARARAASSSEIPGSAPTGTEAQSAPYDECKLSVSYPKSNALTGMSCLMYSLGGMGGFFSHPVNASSSSNVMFSSSRPC